MGRLRNLISKMIGRWTARRIRTKELRDLYRAYAENEARMENGE